MEQVATTTVVAEDDTNNFTTSSVTTRKANEATGLREEPAAYAATTAREQIAVLDAAEPEPAEDRTIARQIADNQQLSPTATEQSVTPQQEQEIVQLSIFGEEEVKPARIKEDPLTKQIISQIQGADLMNMTPLQAMQLLNELKMKTMRT